MTALRCCTLLEVPGEAKLRRSCCHFLLHKYGQNERLSLRLSGLPTVKTVVSPVAQYSPAPDLHAVGTGRSN